MTHPSTVADTLDAAADLLSKPGAWIQGYWARDADGGAILNGNSPHAVCWCMTGAIEKVADTDSGYLTDAGKFLEDMLDFDPEGWNDEDWRTQDQVVAKLREAAAKARGEVQP